MNKKIILAALLLLGFSSLAVRCEEPEKCPQCGEWDVIVSSPNGALGEKIVFDEDHITIPACGRFKVKLIKAIAQPKPITLASSYQFLFALSSVSPEPLCGGPDSTSDLQLRVDLYGKRGTDAGAGRFAVSKFGSEKAIINLTAWNIERNDPCGSGGSEGSAACLTLVNAKLYGSLALEAYEAYTLPAVDFGTRQFNPARFAARTLAFCTKREANGGGGDWPQYWALSCQRKLFQEKLTQLRRWKNCTESKKRMHCSLPTEAFSKSSTDWRYR